MQLTTGGSPLLSVEERLNTVLLGPEMCSLNMGLLNFFIRGQRVFFSNHREDIERFAREMQRRRVRPELELYTMAMLEEAEHLIASGLIDPPYLINAETGHSWIAGRSRRRAALAAVGGKARIEQALVRIARAIPHPSFALDDLGHRAPVWVGPAPIHPGASGMRAHRGIRDTPALADPLLLVFRRDRYRVRARKQCRTAAIAACCGRRGDQLSRLRRQHEEAKLRQVRDADTQQHEQQQQRKESFGCSLHWFAPVRALIPWRYRTGR